MVIDSFLVKCYCENMRSTARGSAVSGGIMRVSFFKRTIFVLIVVLSVITAFALAGCEDKDGCTHVWNDGEITTAATCTQDGVKTFTCTLCGETRTEVVGSSGHVASETFVNTDPEGHYHVCSVCGEKTDDVQAHAFEDGEVIKQPSATEEGLQKIVCSVCGYESTKVLSPETHTHVFDREVADAKYLVSEATCIAKAVYYKSCACGEKGTETFEYGEYVAHTLVKTDRVEPTCIENGTEAYWTCSACGKLFSDENGTTEIGEPVAIPATGDHVYGADLVKDETYHWHACGGCSQQFDKAAHEYNVQKVSDEYLASAATCMNKATYYYSCECGAKGTATFESGEVAGHVFDQEVADQKYLVSEATCTAKAVYYKSCVCGETGTETFEYGEFAEHTLVGGHDADVHYDECSVCHARFNESAHEWDGGVVTTKPTLTTEGEKTYTCACGETKVEKLAAQASFADDFTLEEGQPGSWSYGSVNYVWGAQEDFTFTQITSKNDGGDGWAADGVEIKGGWINASKMMAVAYTVDSDVTVKVNLTFTGGTADTRLSLRTGVKNADGVIYGNPAYFDGGKQSNVLNYETTLELKAGDTVYFILGNENDENPAAYPNGELDIVLTQVIG